MNKKSFKHPKSCKCGGAGAVACDECAGGKEFWCEDCKGAGNFHCEDCDGYGTRDCAGCNGYGVCDCVACNAYGVLLCGTCEGEGNQSCGMVGDPKFPREVQLTDWTCGPCCVFTITQYFGCGHSYQVIKKTLKSNEEVGTDDDEVIKYLRSQKLRVASRPAMNWAQLVQSLERGGVVLVTLDGDHYGVVHAIDEDEGEVYLSDPAINRQFGRTTSIVDFKARWDMQGIIVSRRTARARTRKKTKKS